MTELSSALSMATWALSSFASIVLFFIVFCYLILVNSNCRKETIALNPGDIVPGAGKIVLYPGGIVTDTKNSVPYQGDVIFSAQNIVLYQGGIVPGAKNIVLYQGGVTQKQRGIVPDA